MEMYAGQVACCPLVSHIEYVPMGQMDGQMPDLYITLFARHGQCNTKAAADRHEKLRVERTWSTMPSSADRTVGCMSRWTCIIRLQRHIGVVALIGPMSVAAAAVDWEPAVVVVIRAVDADDDDAVLATAQLQHHQPRSKNIHKTTHCMMGDIVFFTRGKVNVTPENREQCSRLQQLHRLRYRFFSCVHCSSDA